MKRLIGITGSPGTGKKTVGQLLAKSLNFKLIDLNLVAIDKGAVIGDDESGFIANPRTLRRVILNMIGEDGHVVVGHLIPDVFRKGELELVVVLRCAPSHLEMRLAKRNYLQKKLNQNLVVEALDICLHEAISRFGEEAISEHDTTGRKTSNVASEILQVIKGRSKRKKPSIDWLKDYANHLPPFLVNLI